MRKPTLTEAQIASVLKHRDEGPAVVEACRKAGFGRYLQQLMQAGWRHDAIGGEESAPARRGEGQAEAACRGVLPVVSPPVV
ncbi:hypothetical protein [Aureimonas sp. SA4125]|uniref:hypothetical protein n=1 Tax=Aureimonas sp. SA4125 TaxID=2826993 RepID=UPI001CC75DBD|nr:hypothetical protein [Aureimonas sp. SA4125]